MITTGNPFHKGNGLGPHVLDLLKVKQASQWPLTVAGSARKCNRTTAGHPSLEGSGSPLNSLILPPWPSAFCPSFTLYILPMLGHEKLF